MVLPGVPKSELEDMRQKFRRFLKATREEYEQKYMQYETLSREIAVLGDSIRSIKGSLDAVERALGLSPEQVRLPETRELKLGKPVGDTEAAMRIVASRQESGGISFDEILRELHSQGRRVTREYLHTILNRKKNYQGKLSRDENGKWFLTDKGKQELDIE
jgi:hypothetical protein